MSNCKHKNAIVIQGGLLYPDVTLYNYHAAYCPDCKAIREEAAFTKAEPWITTKEDLENLPKRIVEPKIKKKTKKKTRKRERKGKSYE